MKYIELTSAQKELIDLLKHKEAQEYFHSLKEIHYLGTYCVMKDLVNLSASQYVHHLLDSIQKIALENESLDKE